MDSAINVVFITDENYVLPTLTALFSMKINSKSKINAFVIAEKISKNSVIAISNLSDENFNIIIKQIKNPYSSVKTTHRHVTKAAMIKFALPNLFPELNKILYLDSDILVEKDLSELYKTNLDGIYVAAVADMAGMVEESLHLRLGLEKYLNSGMMLLNLEKMREENISDKLLDAKLNDKIKQFMDQDAFNQVFAGNVKWLSSTFNLMKPNLECYSLEEIAKFYEHTISKMEEIMKTPHINHLTNILKPWKTSEATEFEHWYFYFQQLPESKTKTFARIKLCSNKYILKTEKLKKFIQQIFSISNRENYKCIFILGIKIKIKRQS